ncbi:lanthionine synthetase LanC family protein [Kribbella sp. NPDC051718]|uniref:lanthionine synthetase LanC family protein n=1 Tax=Kribbella sp. NPDC051718 TaxID=3155168 RepID=UPI0034129727
MAAVYRRPWSARQIGDSPGLCHGVAGLLQITLRFADDTGEPVFTEAAVPGASRFGTGSSCSAEAYLGE